MVVRYMGTKRHMVTSVQAAIEQFGTSGRAVDLFSGMGSVAEALSNGGPSVVTNDAMEFTACVARARLTGGPREDDPAAVTGRLWAPFQAAQAALKATHAEALSAEKAALAGTISDLSRYFTSAAHVANSPSTRRAALFARNACGQPHFQLATLYFSAGYLSASQAIDVDALRFAIDSDEVRGSRDWLLSAWLSAVSVLLNSPGHTAQYLKPNSASAHQRIVRTWKRSVWDEFVAALSRVSQLGTPEWRAGNEVLVSDALDLLSSGRLTQVGVIYADPPYTKDQYSRYYHLYETLYRYDYPDSVGAGRVRSDRFTTGFSLKSSVRASFHDLCRNVSRMELPLIVSYPTGGLLELTGLTFKEVANTYFAEVEVSAISAQHSTMGASSGSPKKTATENLYVCTGRRN